MLGLSGASGIPIYRQEKCIILQGWHSCFKCTITTTEMQLPKCQRGTYPLQNLKETYNNFQKAEGNIKVAKESCNVISEQILNIKVDQVNVQK